MVKRLAVLRLLHNPVRAQQRLKPAARVPIVRQAKARDPLRHRNTAPPLHRRQRDVVTNK